MSEETLTVFLPIEHESLIFTLETLLFYVRYGVSLLDAIEQLGDS